MRHLQALGLALCMLIPLADAASDAEAFTKSNLISYGSDFSVLRTFTNNLVSTPDLNFQSFGEVNTELTTVGGDSTIEQSLYFSAEKTADFASYGSLSHSFTAENAIHADAKMTCSGYSAVTNSYEWTTVESTATGLTIALPGTEDYELSLTGGYNTKTNTGTIPIPLWMIEEVKEFTLTFDYIDLDWDEPVDNLHENAVVDFVVLENDLASYNYDFERDISEGDTSCEVDMELTHIVRD